MLATSGDVTSLGGAWSWEFKLDGQRAMAVANGGGVRLSSRNGSTITRTYPEITLGLREALDGSLSHQVAEHAGRPVLIVPPPRGER